MSYQMRWQARAFLYIVIVAAATVAVYVAGSLREFLADLTHVNSGVLWFALVAIISEYRAVDFRIGSHGSQPRSSLAILPFLGSIVLFGTPTGIAIVAITSAISQLIFRRKDIERAFFNIAQGVLSAAAGGALFGALAGSSWSAIHDYGFILLGEFFLLAGTFFAVNIGLSSVALSLIGDTPLAEVLARVAGPGGANILYDLVASPIALVLVVLYNSTGPWGILLIAIPLELIRYTYTQRQDLIRANDDLLYVLVKAIETRDPYTSGHSRRVATMARVIAEDLNVRRWDIADIERAALLHDIGKIDADYAAVIQKPEDLSAAERTLIQTHALRGAELLQSLNSVRRKVVSGVRHHHERYDGRGYPDGLAQGAIPLAARIIMICDSVDAMLSDRPYRNALSMDVVRAELLRCAGTQFDPYIVEVMLRQDTLNKAAALVERSQKPPHPLSVA